MDANTTKDLFLDRTVQTVLYVTTLLFIRLILIFILKTQLSIKAAYSVPCLFSAVDLKKKKRKEKAFWMKALGKVRLHFRIQELNI